MSHKENHPGSMYYVIPSQVFEDKRLDHTHLVFYALLSGLAFHDGYCYAGNDYLAERMGLKSETTIQKWLRDLENLGYIRREITKEGMKTRRKIFLTHSNISYAPPKMGGRHRSERVVDTAGNGSIVSKVNRVSKAEVVSETNPPPLVPPERSYEEVYDPNKEEEEEIERRIRNRPKGSLPILNLKKYKIRVLHGMREDTAERITSDELAIRHRLQAFMQDGKTYERWLIVANDKYVEFCMGTSYKTLDYDVSDEEWKQEWLKRCSINI